MGPTARTSPYVIRDRPKAIIYRGAGSVSATISVGLVPFGAAVSPDGGKVYVTNTFFNGFLSAGTVSVIDTATNMVSASIPVGDLDYFPAGVAVTPDGSKVYVTIRPFTVSVIDTATNTVSATIPVGLNPTGVAVSPDGGEVYVANSVAPANTISVIDTATNTVSATITVGLGPFGVAVNPDGSKVYVTNSDANTVSVIDTATNTVSATIPVGFGPLAFGVFIQPPPRAGRPPQFAGVPGSENCLGTSVSALATKFGGLDAAAAALGFSTVQGLQDAIRAFCEG
jgi:YVTN family beta-propeller protein